MRALPGIVGVAFAVLVTACTSTSTTPAPGPSAPSSGKIQHIVILMQENRSFDNIFAGFPGANTTMQGKCAPAPWCKGSHIIKLHSVDLATGSPNTGTDICHSHACFVTECDPTAQNVCQMAGFDLIRKGQSGQGPPAKTYPYAYVKRSQTKAYWDLAKQYTLADEMFDTETASSFIAHQEVIAGSVELNSDESETDQPDTQPWGCDAYPGTTVPVLKKNKHYGIEDYNGPFPCFKYATIADLMDSKTVSWLYYIDKAFGKNSDFSGCCWNGYRAIHKIFYGPDWKSNMSLPNTSIFADVSGGTLPAVSWVIPTLYDSDHPASGCDGGPWWITKVVNAIGTSKYWNNTAIVLLWDDWGGWYDNAPPTWLTYTRLGFRVPMIVISPYAKPRNISHTHYDYGSILKLIEETFNLGSLGTTDATANSMQDAFDFTQTPNKFTTAPVPHAMKCAREVTNPGGASQVIEHDGGPPG